MNLVSDYSKKVKPLFQRIQHGWKLGKAINWSGSRVWSSHMELSIKIKILSYRLNLHTLTKCDLIAGIIRDPTKHHVIITTSNISNLAFLSHITRIYRYVSSYWVFSYFDLGIFFFVCFFNRLKVYATLRGSNLQIPFFQEWKLISQFAILIIFQRSSLLLCLLR